MTTLKRELWVSSVAVALTAVTGTAFAQAPDDSQQPADPTYPDGTMPADPPPQPPPDAAPSTPPPQSVPPPAEPDYSYEGEPGTMARMRQVGIAVSLGGGVMGFTDSLLRDTTDIGGSWAVRAALGTRSPLGFEASYFGSAQGIDALGLSNSAILVSNGVQGVLRINATTNMGIQPFAFAGVAWAHYSVANSDTNTSDIRDSDNVLEVPVGIGVGGFWRGLTLDVRGEIRFATNEDLVPELGELRGDDDFASMHRWGVNATIGYGF